MVGRSRLTGRARARRRRLRQQQRAKAAARPARQSPARSPAPARAPRRPPRKRGPPNSRTQNSGATIAYDAVGSGGGREQFISGGDAFAGSDAALRRGTSCQGAKRCGRASWSRSRTTSRRSRSSTTSRASTTCSSARKRSRRSSTGKITNWNDPAIAKDNPGVELPSTRITPVQPLGRVGHDGELHRLPLRGRASVWTYEVSGDWPVKGGEAAHRHVGRGRSGQGRRRRDRLRRCQPGRGTRHSEDQSRQQLRGADAGGCRQDPRSVEGGPELEQGTVRVRVRNRPQDRGRRASTRSCWSRS